MNNVSILVVDDDDNYRDTLRDILELNDWTVAMAADGYRAVDMAKENEYDLVLLDVNMPGIDGIETFNLIKKIRPAIKAVIMTASNIEPLKGLLREGVSAVLQKPFDLSRITAMINDAKKE